MKFKPVLFLLFGFLLFAVLLEPQELKFGFTNTDAVLVTVNNTFEDVASISLSSPSSKAIRVIANVKMKVDQDASNLNGYFRFTDDGGTSGTPEISSFFETKNYHDRGLVALVNIFSYGSRVRSTTFTLKHKRTAPGVSKNVSSKANMVAIVLGGDI